jgi:hypothetical protein
MTKAEIISEITDMCRALEKFVEQTKEIMLKLKYNTIHNFNNNKNTDKYLLNFANNILFFIVWFLIFRRHLFIDAFQKINNYVIIKRRNGIIDCSHKIDCGCIRNCFDFGKRRQREVVSLLLKSNHFYLSL